MSTRPASLEIVDRFCTHFTELFGLFNKFDAFGQMEVDSAISTPCDLNSSPKFDMAVDPEYEFHAPKFYDFTKGDDNSSLSGDSFFDKMENEEWPLPSLGKMTLSELILNFLIAFLYFAFL